MQELADIFERAASERTFPGGVVFLAHDGNIRAHAAFGSTAYEHDLSRKVTTNTLYDVASITKLWTTAAFLIAVRDNETPIETPVAQFLPEFARPGLKEITLRHLLNHTNGLRLHIQELTDVSPDAWSVQIAGAGLLTQPGDTVRYTCTAYFLLGKLIEQWSGLSLDRFMNERLVGPLGLINTLYNPLRRFAQKDIAPTEINGETGEPWRGVVHDEAARALGGVSGNAGLFSTAADLACFAELWLNEGQHQGRQIIHPEDVRRALTESIVAENYRQALGWHLNVSSWMSLRAPQGTAGHLGFTGPSLFISPNRHICIVLDNRVYPTRDGPLRLKYHRKIAEWLFANSE